ncbi:MAG: hypothetical protein AAFP80_10975 [Pseudomonadota bacterium]
MSKTLKLLASSILMNFALVGYTSADDTKVIKSDFESYAYGEMPLSDGVDYFAAQPATSENTFKLGALLFIQAIEGLQQDLHRLGAGNVTIGDEFTRATIPIFRVPVPPNDAPETATYEATRQLLSNFVMRLESVDETLGAITPEDFVVSLDLLKIAVDADSSGKATAEERFGVLLQTMDPRLSPEAAIERLEQINLDSLQIGFDNADAKWLQGYANLLAGTAKLILAFNYERTYDVSAQHIFGYEANEVGKLFKSLQADPQVIAALQEEIKALRAEIDEVRLTVEERQRLSELNSLAFSINRDQELSESQRVEQLAAFQQERTDLDLKRQNFSRLSGELLEKRGRLSRLTIGVMGRQDLAQSLFEPIAFIHSINWPVEDRQMLTEVRDHWLKVLALNHETWSLVTQETDDEKEWLPNPNQTSPFRGVRVSQEQIDAWLELADIGEQVLNGELLIPSWRLPTGINVKLFFDTAERFDLVSFATGHDSALYSQPGQEIDRQRMRELTRVFGRNIGMFAIWFN